MLIREVILNQKMIVRKIISWPSVHSLKLFHYCHIVQRGRMHGKLAVPSLVTYRWVGSL